MFIGCSLEIESEWVRLWLQMDLEVRVRFQGKSLHMTGIQLIYNQQTYIYLKAN